LGAGTGTGESDSGSVVASRNVSGLYDNHKIGYNLRGSMNKEVEGDGDVKRMDLCRHTIVCTGREWVTDTGVVCTE